MALLAGPGTERQAPAATFGAARPVIFLRDVTKTYPGGKVALRDVDLTIREGEFVFIVGPSGAGKSTLLKLLIRDEVATEGQVFIDGTDLPGRAAAAGLPRGAKDPGAEPGSRRHS